MRYDLKLDFKRMETVRAEKGYHGPAVVCAIYFSPVAGYIPDRPVIKYLAAQRNIEIAFAPIAGTRILVPFWVRIPTPLGTGHAGSHPVHHHGHPAARRQDELRGVRWQGQSHNLKSSCPALCRVSTFSRAAGKDVDGRDVGAKQRFVACPAMTTV